MYVLVHAHMHTFVVFFSLLQVIYFFSFLPSASWQSVLKEMVLTFSTSSMALAPATFHFSGFSCVQSLEWGSWVWEGGLRASLSIVSSVG